MSDRVFLDSNVVVYSVDESPAEKVKHERAIEVLSGQPESLVLSTQVLQEFYVVTTRKLKKPLSEERAAKAIAGYRNSMSSALMLHSCSLRPIPRVRSSSRYGMR
jgi:predicted nucleic acid-binding protein